MEITRVHQFKNVQGEPKPAMITISRKQFPNQGHQKQCLLDGAYCLQNKEKTTHLVKQSGFQNQTNCFSYQLDCSANLKPHSNQSNCLITYNTQLKTAPTKINITREPLTILSSNKSCLYFSIIFWLRFTSWDDTELQRLSARSVQ